MAGRYPIKFFNATQRDAPVLNGTPGSFINLLRKCLIEGFGESAAITGEILNGVCTLQFNGGESFDKDKIVLITGSGIASIDGEQRVTSSSNNSISFPTLEDDGLITNPVTVKYAPVGGWITPYTGTNVAAFKATALDSSGVYFRIDDTTSRYASMRMYNTMSGINEGGGDVPFESSNPCYFYKSGYENADPKIWELVSDDYTCYFGSNKYYAPSELYTRSIGYSGFGDYVCLKSKHTNNAFILATTNSTYNNSATSCYVCGIMHDYNNSGFNVIRYRNPTTGSYSLDTKKPEGFNTIIGTGSIFNTWASGLPKEINVSYSWSSAHNGDNREVDVRRIMLTGHNNKEVMPGLYAICNGLPTSMANQHLQIWDFIEGYEDKKFLVIVESSVNFGGFTDINASSKSSRSGNGGYFSLGLVDIIGPWR